MRTTLTIDDDLLSEASRLTGIAERPQLIRHALETVIQIEAGRRLAALGGSDRAAQAAPLTRT